MRPTRTLLLAAAVAGFGPFTCDDPTVERARKQFKDKAFPAAVETLSGVDEDAPEVHLARGLALLSQEKAEVLEAAETSLDQAYRLVAERNAVLSGDAPEVAQARAALTDLRKRVAFAKGLLAMQKQSWATALGEFQRVVELDPTDDDARWNLEVAYFKLNPPCRLRDDDHEPDSSNAAAQPWSAEKSKDRVLCPNDEDWYTADLALGSAFWVSVEGEVKPTDDEDDTRALTVELFAPSTPFEAAASAPMEPAAKGRASIGFRAAPESGAWRIRVSGAGRAEVKYTLSLETPPPCPADDDAEENDALETPVEAQDGQRPNLKACPGDDDWFKVTIPEKSKRVVRPIHDPQRGPLTVQLFGLDGQPIGEPGPTARAEASESGPLTVLAVVRAATPLENTYVLDVSDGEGGKDDQNNAGDQGEPPPPSEGGEPPPSQPPGGQPPPPQSQSLDQVDMNEVLDKLDKNQGNPQLEKLLRSLKTVPSMEDY